MYDPPRQWGILRNGPSITPHTIEKWTEWAKEADIDPNIIEFIRLHELTHLAILDRQKYAKRWIFKCLRTSCEAYNVIFDWDDRDFQINVGKLCFILRKDYAIGG